MKFRRAGSAALAAILFSSSVCICAEAADKEMETALTYVKQRINIEKEFTEFNHSSYTEYGKKCYRFNWSTPDGMKGWNISIKGNVITRVNKYDYNGESWYNEDVYTTGIPSTETGAKPYDPNSPHFSKITESELLTKAKSWMQQINPTINSQLETLDDNFSINVRGVNATLRFRRVNNGVPVAGQSGSITLNKDTGDIINYNLNWINGATFAPLENTISKSAAIEGYKKEFPAELVYLADYNYETKKYTAHLVYRQTGSGEIDAFTGKKSTYEDYDAYDEYEDDVAIATADADDDANPATGGGYAVSFTPNEIKKLEEEEKLIKAEDSMKKLEQDGIFLIPQNWEITSEGCSYDERLGFYTRGISFQAKVEAYIDVDGEPIMPLDEGELPPGAKQKTYTYSGNYSINAETGDVIYFYCNDPYYSYTQSMDVAKTTARATNYMKTLLGKNYAKFTLDKEPNISSYYKNHDENGKAIGDPTITSIGFTAPRTANGIKSTAESVSFTIGQSNKIKNYSLQYYGLSYPKPEGKLTADEAYNKFFEQVDYSMTYRCAYRTKDKKVVSALVYKCSDNMRVDAFTGERVDYSGVIMPKSEIKPNSYSDLKGSDYAKYAEKLLLYGVCIADDNGKLSENDIIDAKTFSNLVSRTINYSYLYKDTKPEDKVSNKLAAKIIVRALYGDNIASIQGIFKSPFKDVKDSNKYTGYIAIANAEGIMTGNDGNFKPNNALTRGKALKLIYDYLK